MQQGTYSLSNLCSSCRAPSRGTYSPRLFFSFSLFSPGKCEYEMLRDKSRRETKTTDTHTEQTHCSSRALLPGTTARWGRTAAAIAVPDQPIRLQHHRRRRVRQAGRDELNQQVGCTVCVVGGGRPNERSNRLGGTVCLFMLRWGEGKMDMDG